MGNLNEPCASCHMHCCTHFAVPLTGFDVARIAKKLKCKPEEFCELAPADEIESPPHSNIFIFDDSGKMHEKTLVLRKGADGSCVFFRKMQGCGIHGFHPVPCTAYPFVFDEKGRIKLNKHFICPRKWKNGEYDEKGVRKTLSQMEVELATHDKIIRKWNAKEAEKRTADAVLDDFVAFLLDETSDFLG